MGGDWGMRGARAGTGAGRRKKKSREGFFAKKREVRDGGNLSRGFRKQRFK